MVEYLQSSVGIIHKNHAESITTYIKESVEEELEDSSSDAKPAPKQLQMPHILFTGLEDYKTRGTQASAYFMASFYKEFAKTKDLVLVRGDVVFPSKLTGDEAKWLLERARSFYLNDTRYALVEWFNKRTSDFEFNEVLRALEMPSA